MSLLEKPARCEARIHVGLKFTQPVLGVLPRNRKALVGMFSVAFKGKKDYPPERIAEIADHVLEELGGESSPMTIQGLKKTRTGYYYIGAGCLKGCLSRTISAVEAEAHGSDGLWRGAKVWSRSRIFMDPGKLVLHKIIGTRLVPVTSPDGQEERTLPPSWGRPNSAIVISDYVDCPFIHFDLWYDGHEIDQGQLRSWLEAAGMLGMMGWRTAGFGEFEVVNFEPRQPFIAAGAQHAYDDLPCHCLR